MQRLIVILFNNDGFSEVTRVSRAMAVYIYGWPLTPLKVPELRRSGKTVKNYTMVSAMV
jgi:hypothetical protein